MIIGSPGKQALICMVCGSVSCRGPAESLGDVAWIGCCGETALAWGYHGAGTCWEKRAYSTLGKVGCPRRRGMGWWMLAAFRKDRPEFTF